MLTGLVILIIGFAGGRFFQQAKSGYHYEVRDAREYESPSGTVRWSYVTESAGTPLLDSGTTIIEVDGRTIYKAGRGFQESSPFAKNINVSQDMISWDDGDFRYDLRLRRMIPGGQAPPATDEKPTH